MSIFGLLFIGLIAGWLAGLINNSIGFGLVVELLVGVFSALLSGLLLRFFALHIVGFLGSLVFAMISAILALFVMGLIKQCLCIRKSKSKQLTT